MRYTADKFKEDLRFWFHKKGVRELRFEGNRVSYVDFEGEWKNLPKGWTKESVKKFWKSLTGDVKHKVTKCIKQMEGKIDDPAAFCNSLSTMI